MIPDFIITFRETLEAALIIGIVLSYLIRTKNEKYKKTVFIAVISAIVASIIGAFLFNLLAGGFSGVAEEIFEGIVMILGSILISYMIVWMMNQKHLAIDLHKKLKNEIGEKHKWGIFFLVFIAVLREGIETVIFLKASSLATGGSSFLGAALGIITAIILGYIIFVVGKKIDLKLFFNITSVILILFAAGLAAHGVHELQEAHVVPTLVEHVWDINPPLRADESFPALHENGSVGSMLKGLFGYNGNPSLIEVLSYIAYIGIILFIIKKKFISKA